MTQRDDLLGRVKELRTATEAHRATARVIRAMVFDGDYAGASTALDDLEAELHPTLTGGGGGGSGLPEQWTDGGNGDVTATVDDPDKTPVTLEGTASHNAALLVIDEPDDGSNYSDVVVIVGDKGGPNESNLFYIDSAGEVQIIAKDAGATALHITPGPGAGAFGAHIVVVDSDGVPGNLLDIEATGKVSMGNTELPNGLLLHGPHAAPGNSEMNNGDLMFWFDQTNGAAKLMIKAKTANGTVVTGQLALS